MKKIGRTIGVIFWIIVLIIFFIILLIFAAGVELCGLFVLIFKGKEARREFVRRNDFFPDDSYYLD